jgi:hypothetical protein
MAMDHLPIQATSVPCERVFSSSGKTDTKRRNHLNPMLMEALQRLKFHLKKERLSFTASWVMGETEMSTDEPEVDLLSELVRANSNNASNQVQEDIMQAISSYED